MVQAAETATPSETEESITLRNETLDKLPDGLCGNGYEANDRSRRDQTAER